MDAPMTEEASPRSGSAGRCCARYFLAFRPHYRALTFCIFLLGLSATLSLAGPLLIRHAIDVDFASRDLGGLVQTALLFAGVLALTAGSNYLQQVNLEILGQRIVLRIRTESVLAR